jgi:hypothetical protein
LEKLKPPTEELFRKTASFLFPQIFIYFCAPLYGRVVPENYFSITNVLIKTKKYKLEPALYIKTAMLELLRKQWWYIIGPVAVACLAFIWPSWWFISIAILIVVLYLLFWAVQFAGVSQILMKLNERQGMPVSWDMIKSAKKTKEHYLLALSKAQFIFLPYNIFTNPNDLKMMDTYLRRKNLLAAEAPKTAAA